MIPQHRLQSIGKSDGPAQVVNIIMRVRSFLGPYPRTGQIRQIGQLRRPQAVAVEFSSEVAEDWFHEGGVEGVRNVQPVGIDAGGKKTLSEAFDRRDWATDDATVRRIDRGDRQVAV